jgi:AmmeMemoRadiSam system protein A
MPSLSEADRHSILDLARKAILDAVCHERVLEPIPQHGIFAERRGVFISLHLRGHLRGCIGVIEPDEPLGESLARCAASAALEDPRFSPLRPEEIPGVHIEVSLLSPLAPIAPEDIEIGRHGLLVTQGPRRGLLLPQVATEHHFERERFLEETCWKAGLPRDAWRQPETRIFGFTCEVFSEERRHGED